jgi:hypothetical protein
LKVDEFFLLEGRACVEVRKARLRRKSGTTGIAWFRLGGEF